MPPSRGRFVGGSGIRDWGGDVAGGTRVVCKARPPVCRDVQWKAPSRLSRFAWAGDTRRLPTAALPALPPLAAAAQCCGALVVLEDVKLQLPRLLLAPLRCW